MSEKTLDQLRRFKIGDIQKSEEEEENRERQESEKRKAMFESFKKHGLCPDYKSGECDSKLGVYNCWVEGHRKYKCRVMDYSARK